MSGGEGRPGRSGWERGRVGGGADAVLTAAVVGVAAGPRAALQGSGRLPHLSSLSPGWRRLEPLYN